MGTPPFSCGGVHLAIKREEQGLQKSLLIAVIPIYRRILERAISFKGFYLSLF